MIHVWEGELTHSSVDCTESIIKGTFGCTKQPVLEKWLCLSRKFRQNNLGRKFKRKIAGGFHVREDQDMIRTGLSAEL